MKAVVYRQYGGPEVLRFTEVATPVPKDDDVLIRIHAEDGELTPVIDRRYRFDEIVEAHRYVDTGRKKGNVVLTLEH